MRLTLHAAPRNAAPRNAARRTPHAARLPAPQVPKAWEESDPRYIANSDEVRLRSFTTKVHRVDASVTYKAD